MALNCDGIYLKRDKNEQQERGREREREREIQRTEAICRRSMALSINSKQFKIISSLGSPFWF